MSVIHRVLTGLVLAAVAVGIVGAPAGAAVRTADPVYSLTFDRFDADYALGLDHGIAVASVTETITARFPDADVNHGIDRYLIEQEGGIDYQLQVTGVTDASGARLQYTTSHDDTPSGFLRVRIGDPDTYVHGEHTYVIRYQLRNVVRHYADTDDAEFYWDINGEGWDYPFGEVSAHVHLLDGLAAATTGKQACYPGAAEASLSAAPCTISRDGDTVTSSVTGVLARHTLTVAIGFENSAVLEPTRIRDLWWWSLLPWCFLALALAGLAWLVLLRLGPLRNARSGRFVVPEYSPPPGAWPGLAANLMGYEKRAFPSEIVGLAVSGYVTIAEIPNAPARSRYQLTLVNPDWSALDITEQSLLRALFPFPSQGAVRVLDQGDRLLGSALSPVLVAMAKRVFDLELRARPRIPLIRTVSLFLVLFGIAAIVHLVLAIGAGAATIATGAADVGAAVLFLVTAILAGSKVPITVKGAILRDQLEGLRVYIRLAESDRLRVLQGPATAERIDLNDSSQVLRLYERVLPYAIVFGLAKEWTQVLSDRYAVTGEVAPSWYYGTAGIAGFAAFTATAATMSIDSIVASSSGGSSFGGSDGGGFSGGGDGGGGGGGW
jgi:uncharacterized membrane protein YgcG